MSRGKAIGFYKMSGCGNDFILLDHRKKFLADGELKQFASKICAHRLSVGGDGLILLEKAKGSTADFSWRLFNADGSEAEFSGNGGRCAARLAYLLKIAPARMTFETLAGLIKARVHKENVTIQFPRPQDLRLGLKIPVDGKTYEGHFLNTGVPHLVYIVSDLEKAAVIPLGRKSRHHEIFQPSGTNVNFISVKDSRRIEMRTYERGVENETLACGTGAVASALIAGALGKVSSPVSLKQRSGQALEVTFDWDGSQFGQVFLSGEARMIYQGQLWEEALSHSS
jgi:diaminopimelate epimerase